MFVKASLTFSLDAYILLHAHHTHSWRGPGGQERGTAKKEAQKIDS